eukprot:CAMPEP_0117671428 /NCGR_PEP_ID=MMETSP0804-20121206/13326_1 /TAXON_ID=1074897 /ORGANISM="Tetraselmis astigmatica, Strain CCMP880" /LENGTH=569 /DNA_ID=CAMNT_0005479883 /DNA_START=21 /DNA_END=1730 /DNA_ORIENTATION=+
MAHAGTLSHFVPRHGGAAATCALRRVSSRSFSPGNTVPGTTACLSARAAGAGHLTAARPLRESKGGRKARPDRRGLSVRAAAFDNLTNALNATWSKLKGEKQLTPENIKEPMRDIRRALLEADVSLPVVRRFIKNVEESAIGAGVVKGVEPGQQLVKVVNEELVKLMGGKMEGLVTPDSGPQIILMAGLQGVGKTTQCGKLANKIMKEKKNNKVLMVAGDVYRPAAIDQLVKVGSNVGADVFQLGTEVPPVEIAMRGVQKAIEEEYDAVIIDTAGRLNIDEAMMKELQDVKNAVNPSDVLLVVDAMTGQEAASLVKSFNDQVELTGAILTKTDGDSRGGAALTVREISGKPIKFVGTGEKMDNLEPFYPDRMAGRILGMGDVLTLVEKAEEAIAAEEAERIQEKMRSAKFDYNDFLKQFEMMNNMGPMGQVMKMLPGMSKISDRQMMAAEKKFSEYEAMINAMTEEERSDPDLIASTPSLRRRIAKDSGFPEDKVVEMISTFAALRMQMQTMSRMMAIKGGDMDMMSDEEMLNSTLQGMGPRPVAAGKVRRKKGKKGSRALAELSELRS